MKTCVADLHVHTALSPCADDAMTPPAIVERALAEGLAMIAVCDHNSARNVAAVQACAGERLAVLAGMEVTTSEECHVLGYFPTTAAAQAAGAEVAATLPAADGGYEQFFGRQQVLSADGDETAREPAALAMATPLDVSAAVALVHRHGGLAAAAHIDRPHFGVLGQLGFFPAEAGFDAAELSRHVTAHDPRLAGYESYGLALLQASDAHYLADVGAARTELRVAAPTFTEFALALRGADGRSVARA